MILSYRQIVIWLQSIMKGSQLIASIIIEIQNPQYLLWIQRVGIKLMNLRNPKFQGQELKILHGYHLKNEYYIIISFKNIVINLLTLLSWKVVNNTAINLNNQILNRNGALIILRQFKMNQWISKQKANFLYEGDKLMSLEIIVGSYKIKRRWHNLFHSERLPLKWRMASSLKDNF